MTVFQSRGSVSAISYGFSDPLLCNRNIQYFCRRFLRMKNPVISQLSRRGVVGRYSDVYMQVIDKRSAEVTVSFQEKTVDREFYIEVYVLNPKDNIVLFDSVTRKDFNRIVGGRLYYTADVYVYALSKDYSEIKKRRCHVGVHGIPGVVQSSRPKSVRTGNTVTTDFSRTNDLYYDDAEFIRKSAMYVWFYEDQEEKAVELLKAAARGRRRKHLKNLAKSEPPKRDIQSNFTQLRKLFSMCGGSDRTITRICNTLNHSFDICNIIDLMQNPVSPSDFYVCYGVGKKMLDCYSKAWSILKRQRELQFLHTT